MPPPDPTRPGVLHLDLDAFFAAVEQRDKPSLRGKPVVVGGTGWRGVVATASYEARVFGIGSAMPTGMARRLCPNAAYLAGRFAAYRQVSAEVMALARELSALVEPVSLDEAYVDLAEGSGRAPETEQVVAVAARFRAEVQRRTGLTVSVGAGASKLVAKIASDLRKPDALVVVNPAEQADLLAPLPVGKIPGVGAKSAARLQAHGLRTIGELAAATEPELVRLLGRAHGGGLWALARGIDPRPVVSEREAKSISVEQTFGTDITDRRDLRDRVGRMSARVVARLLEQGLAGRTITIKVRRYDFQTVNRSRTLQHATAAAPEVALHARELLDTLDVADGVRLLGVGVAGLSEHAQADLFSDQPDAPEHPDAPEQPEATQPPDVRGAGVEVVGEEEAVEPAEPAEPARASESVEPEVWRPGQDVAHDEHGTGWVQGSGAGRVTVRFEGPGTPVGRVRTFALTDPALAPADPPRFQASSG